jgi:choline-sulfatase
MLGERGMWYKMSFFEWAGRIPIIIHAPFRFAPARVATPVSLVDILPTLVEIATEGNEPAYVDPIDGKSLVPLAQGSSESRTAHGELLGEGAIAPLLMIRRGDYKYIFSAPDPEQLYDLAHDPHERNNLAADGDYATIRQQFYDELMAKWDVAALRETVIASQKRRRMINQAHQIGRHTAWDFQPFDDATQKYMRNHLDLNVLEKSARYPSPAVPPHDGSAR